MTSATDAATACLTGVPACCDVIKTLHLHFLSSSMGATPFELPPRLCLPESRLEKSEPRSSSQPGSSRKGQPWSETEHLQFLAGLKKLGRGNWRGISRYFVPTRTPTQVASHAQKHFLRTNGVCKRKSRFSVLEQAASAQGLLAPDAPTPLSAPLAVPIFYALPSLAAGSTQHPGATTSTSSGSTDHPARSCPEGGAPRTFTKICRPVPYHASARQPDMDKLRTDLAATAAADEKGGTLQPSSRSAFFAVQPCAAISV